MKDETKNMRSVEVHPEAERLNVLRCYDNETFPMTSNINKNLGYLKFFKELFLWPPWKHKQAVFCSRKEAFHISEQMHLIFSPKPIS